MGDAGFILFGPIGREVLSFGTVVFAVFATGGQILAGQIALGVLSSNKLCSMLYTGIFAIPTLLCSLPRTFDQLSWLSVPSVICIIVAGVVGMIGAGLHPIEGWRDQFSVAVSTDFVTAFISITNPVYAYAGTNISILDPARYERLTHTRCRPLYGTAPSLHSTLNALDGDILTVGLRPSLVLHPHLGDASTQQCDESGLHPSDLCHDVLCCFRGRHLHLPRPGCCVSVLHISAPELVKSGVWHRDPQLPDCRFDVLSYGGQVDLHPVLPKVTPSARAYGVRLGCLDILDCIDEWSGVRAGSRCADLQLSDWNCGELVRNLVYVRYCWSFLVV